MPKFAPGPAREARGPRNTTLSRALRLFGLSFALGLSSPALSAEDTTDARLDRLEKMVDQSSERVKRMEGDLSSRTGFIGSMEAMRRFEDAVFSYLLGEYDTAAREFFTLIESGALGDTPELRDSQWYLAESLFEMENYALAEEAYKVMVDAGPGHPFFADSVRRLLEIYGITGDTSSFYAVYNTYIISNRVEPSDLVKYTLAKSFYRQGEQARAKSMLADIPIGSAQYARARYLLGVILVVEGSFTDAIEQFKLVVTVVPSNVEEREIVDLANLALGRIYYETGDFRTSLEYYQRITRASAYFPDALYEMSWTAIKQQDWNTALESVEIFLLAYPEHRYSAQLKVDQGHLYMKQSNTESALVAYQSVVDEYTPVQRSIDKVISDPLAPMDWFRRLASAENLDGFYGGEFPVFALEVLINEPDMGRMLGLYRELSTEKQDLDDATQLIGELERALDAGSVGAIDRSAAALTNADAEVVRLRGELLYLEETWMISYGSPAAAEVARGVRLEREELRRRADESSTDVARSASAQARLIEGYASLRNDLRAQRSQVKGSDAQDVARRIDTMYNQLDATTAQIASLQSKARSMEKGEVEGLKARLEVEKAEVAQSSERVASLMVDAESLASDVTRGAFDQLSEEFQLSLLEADQGIVDVYWVRLIDTSEKHESLLADRKALLGELDQQFSVIRQGLPPARPVGSSDGGKE